MQILHWQLNGVFGKWTNGRTDENRFKVERKKKKISEYG